ncbi:hypothetical protein CYMTET_21986 [Cymbomonas tetramitiformis]|uniref:Uncharacterized protein n=1 Tax=Cymbomonas tetramitiformis TaxID=36881 RepID=A0AAE0G128_9CHLO|nr:hypothetical protein CYMTET_21986 [Cymbomonas tetramitiformis]
MDRGWKNGQGLEEWAGAGRMGRGWARQGLKEWAGAGRMGRGSKALPAREPGGCTYSVASEETRTLHRVGLHHPPCDIPQGRPGAAARQSLPALSGAPEVRHTRKRSALLAMKLRKNALAPAGRSDGALRVWANSLRRAATRRVEQIETRRPTERCTERCREAIASAGCR